MAWLDTLYLECRHGDLFEADVEALACNVNTSMALNYSLGRQLAERGGDGLVSEIRAEREQLQDNHLLLGEAISVPATGLEPFQWVILFAWWAAEGEYTDNLIYKCLINTLRQGFRREVTSLVLPMFGIGSGQVSAERLACQAVKVISDLDKLSVSDGYSIEHVVFASDRQSDIQKMEKELFRLGLL